MEDKELSGIAKELILFIRQNAFLPENDNLDYVVKLIHKRELMAREALLNKMDCAMGKEDANAKAWIRYHWLEIQKSQLTQETK